MGVLESTCRFLLSVVEGSKVSQQTEVGRGTQAVPWGELITARTDRRQQPHTAAERLKVFPLGELLQGIFPGTRLGEEGVCLVVAFRYLQSIAHASCMAHTPPRAQIHLAVREEKRMSGVKPLGRVALLSWGREKMAPATNCPGLVPSEFVFVGFSNKYQRLHCWE